MRQRPSASSPGRPLPSGAAGAGSRPDDGGDLDLLAALAIVQDAERSARRNLSGNAAPIYLLWGLTWAVGYGSLWGAKQGWLALSPDAALLVLGCALAVASITTVVYFARNSRGIRGASAFQGGMYGTAWALGFTVMGALSAVIGRSVSDFWERGLLINSISVLIVGLLYITGGTTFGDRPQSYLGIWLLAVTVAGLVAGPEHFLAVFLFLGAPGLLAAGILEHLRTRPRRNGPARA